MKLLYLQPEEEIKTGNILESSWKIWPLILYKYLIYRNLIWAKIEKLIFVMSWDGQDVIVSVAAIVCQLLQPALVWKR